MRRASRDRDTDEDDEDDDTTEGGADRKKADTDDEEGGTKNSSKSDQVGDCRQVTLSRPVYQVGDLE